MSIYEVRYADWEPLETDEYDDAGLVIVKPSSSVMDTRTYRCHPFDRLEDAEVFYDQVLKTSDKEWLATIEIVKVEEETIKKYP